MAKPWLDAHEMEVIRALLDAGVAFLIVGGRAVLFHGYVRPAKDLDLLVQPSALNWPKLNDALGPLSATLPPFEELSPLRKYRLRLHFYETVELLTAINEVSFEDAWSESIEATVDGLPIRVLSKAHLILSKRHSGREVDAEDVKGLQSKCVENR